MNREAARRAIAGAHLPAELKRYLSAFVDGGADSKLRRLLKADPARLLGEIARVMAQAAETMGSPAEEVLFSTGFHPANFAPARLEAALAELRAVNFLAGEGFSAIRFVPPARGKTADITASRGGNTYAFEVRCVTGGGVPPVSILEKKCRKKMPQAACHKKKSGCSHCGLVFVISPENSAPSGGSGGLTELAAAVYAKAGRPPRAHVCLLSGVEKGVFPGWDGQTAGF